MTTPASLDDADLPERGEAPFALDGITFVLRRERTRWALERGGARLGVLERSGPRWAFVPAGEEARPPVAPSWRAALRSAFGHTGA